jgi:hypothetical protein
MSLSTLLGAALHLGVTAHTPEALDRIEVVGRTTPQQGIALTASEGSVSAAEIAARPLLRVGDLLEFVPGLVATQHSGSGKANQYFLRGFNLDHGTDFATVVDGMPVNLRSHGHGQGYTDLNFLIPEVVGRLDYRKGVHHADIGDFASAGSARFVLRDRLDRSQLALGVGEYGQRRALGLFGIDPAPDSHLLFAVEAQANDGAWRDIEEDLDRRNAVLRMVHEGERGIARATVMHYRNRWNSPDQIPARAVAQGLVDRLGSLDTTLGGDSGRDSLSASWDTAFAGGALRASGYLIDYRLDLWSNFTYFLDDPEGGDQFVQFDRRDLRGGELLQVWDAGRSTWRLGADYRLDDIADVGLVRARARSLTALVRRDTVRQWSAGAFVDVETRWSERLRSSLGLRGDHQSYRVASDLAANSGRQRASEASPKVGLAWLARADLELYANLGEGLHSNDARGTTIRIDPTSGESTVPVDPLVESRGGELGLRWGDPDHLHATASLWTLRLDSEQLFVGDAGTTEAGRASRREGLEFGLYAFLGERWAADLEVAWTRARLRGDDPAGARIPGAIPVVGGLALRYEGGDWYTQARWRHFSRYPLIEDNSRRSAGSDLVHLRLGRRWQQVEFALDVLNLFDSRDHDIDYFYASRLPGEPVEGVEDLHFRAFEPRSLRLSLNYRFH